jgi:hypothetical protein
LLAGPIECWHIEPLSKLLDAMSPVFEFQRADGSWHPFDAPSNAALRRAMAAQSTANLAVTLHGAEHAINLQCGIDRTVADGSSRGVRPVRPVETLSRPQQEAAFAVGAVGHGLFVFVCDSVAEKQEWMNGFKNAYRLPGTKVDKHRAAAPVALGEMTACEPGLPGEGLGNALVSLCAQVSASTATDDQVLPATFKYSK